MRYTRVARTPLLILSGLQSMAMLLPLVLHAQPVNVTKGAQPAPGNFALPFAGSAATGNFGFSIAHSGANGIAIVGTGGYIGIHGISKTPNSRGVYGAAEGAKSVGVEGFSDSESGGGVFGRGFSGVVGTTTYATGSGVWGAYVPEETGKVQMAITFGDPKPKSKGRLGAALAGVEGITNLPGATAVIGRYAALTEGMLGGEVNAVVGKTTVAGGKGVAGRADVGENAVGVYGESAAGLAGFFRGKVTITDRLLVTRIDAEQMYAAKGLIGGLGKMFQIDHPLEPAEKYLWHASVESDDRKNMYDGVVTLDAKGTGWITLPDWFQALNKDFRYQLTCIGGYAPVYIAQEIKNNRFQIAGGKSGLKVSWQVTGVRQDALAKATPFKVEEEKSAADRGKYLNPVEMGFPASLGIHQAGKTVSGINTKTDRP